MRIYVPRTISFPQSNYKLYALSDMNNIFFIRGKTIIDSPIEYESLTDIWLFGDIDGYNYLIKCLTQQIKNNKPVRMLPKNKVSMSVLILSATTIPKKSPRLIIKERLIRLNSENRMEMILFGNMKGYKYLISRIKIMIKNSSNDLSNHIHIDYHDKALIQRSISLNIREPLSEWKPNLLGVYKKMIYQRDEDFLPNIKFLYSWDYEIPKKKDYSLTK